jgi:hypothetical protein
VGTYLPHYAASEHVALIVIAIAITSHKLQILATNNKTKIVVFLIVDDSPVSNFMFHRFGTLCSFFIVRVYTAYEDGTDSVPKRWNIIFRLRGINHKKEYNIHNTEKV